MLEIRFQSHLKIVLTVIFQYLTQYVKAVATGVFSFTKVQNPLATGISLSVLKFIL